MPADGLPWLERERDPALRGDRAAGAAVRAHGRDRRAPHRRRAARAARVPAAARDARRRARASRTSSLTTNGYLLERDADALVDAGHQARERVDRLAPARPLLPDDPPRLAAAGAARARGDRRASPRCARSRSTPSRCAASPRRRRCPFAEFARSTSFQVRFIEFMPLDGDHAWTQDQVLTGEEIRAIIHAVHPLEELPREPHATARVFRFADGQRRDRLRQPGVRAVLRRLQPHPPDRRRQAAHLPLLASTRPTCATPLRGGAVGRRAGADRSATPSGARS